jgi:cardiolipin synthase A/B
MMKHRVDDNDVTLLRNGSEYFPALIAAIDAAQTRAWLETYIFADDETGRRVADALIGAVSRGVDVRVVIDGFGSYDHIGELDRRMKAGGVKLAVFRPETSRWRFRKSRLRRMHRKLALTDEAIAFVGGINIIDDFNMHGHASAESFDARFDFAVRIEGGLSVRIAQTMREMWDRLTDDTSGRAAQLTADSLHALERAGKRAASAMRALRGTGSTTSPLNDSGNYGPNLWFIYRDNVHYRRSIEAAYLLAIKGAKREVFIANAYFFPGRRLFAALNAAEARGVRVRLLLQGRREYFLQHYASRALYDRLFNAGIEIAEYHLSFLHAKVAVIDDQWATVGSSNIDPFSLLLAREANVFVSHDAFADELKQSLEVAWNGASRVVERSDWHRRSLFTRIKSRVAYRVARLLLTIFGYGSK